MAVTLFSPLVFSRDNHLNFVDPLPATLTPQEGGWNMFPKLVMLGDLF